MFRHFISGWFISVLMCFIAGRAATAQLPSERDVRQAIATFCHQPKSDEGRAALKVVVAFAEASDAVSITIAPQYTPWIKVDEELKDSEMLLGANIAGNVLGQLDSGVKGNDPYSATIQVFRVYRSLKANDPVYRVPEIERLLEIHHKGELTAHFAKLEENRNK